MKKIVLPALFWWSSYVAGCRLAVAPQFGAKIHFIAVFTT
jgi:hypothetical protein